MKKASKYPSIDVSNDELKDTSLNHDLNPLTMKNRLEPLSDYVMGLLSRETCKYSTFDIDCIENIEKIDLYTKFLKQNLSERYDVNGVNAHPLNRFVPCDLEGGVLVEPGIMAMYKSMIMECSADEMRRCREYNEAVERVLFEGFELFDDLVKDFYNFMPNDIVISSINFQGGIKFTESKGFYYFKTIEDLVNKVNLTKTGAELCGKTFEG